jgi:hypothetical protein
LVSAPVVAWTFAEMVALPPRASVAGDALTDEVKVGWPDGGGGGGGGGVVPFPVGTMTVTDRGGIV